MGVFLQVLCAFFSAFAETLAIPNEYFYFGSPVLGLVALVPLYCALFGARSRREAALLTGVQTGLTHVLSSFWLANFRDFAVFTLGASALATAAQGIIAGCYLWIPFSARKRLPASDSGYQPGAVFRAVFFAAAWSLYEWTKCWGFLGYPWGTLSMTAVTWHEIKQIAEFTGERGVTFLLALFNAVAAEGILLIIRGKRARAGTFSATSIPKPQSYASWLKAVALCAALFAAALGFGAYRVNRHDEPQKILRAALVQQNIDTWLTSDAKSIAVSQELTERAVADGLSRTGFKPDLCLWSESVLTWPMPEAASRYKTPLGNSNESLTDFIARMGFPFLVGGAITFDAQRGKYGNATLFFDRDGEYKDYYAKMHLVPFAEVLPFTDIPLVKKFFDAILGFSEAWTPGEKLTLFEIPVSDTDGEGNSQTVKFVSPICFEDAFGYVCRELFLQGSELFVNLTNDSWSLTKSAEYQHYAIASYRAIEFRTTLARSTNSGYSVIIDPRGMVIADMPLFSEEYLFAEIPVYKRVVTVFARADVFIIAVIALALFMWARLRLRGKTQRGSSPKKR